MRRALAILSTAMSLAFAGAVATAAPAAAQSPGLCVSGVGQGPFGGFRNIGGSELTGSCTCVQLPHGFRNIGGSVLTGSCTCAQLPDGGRNVGGLLSEHGICWPGSTKWWQFPRFPLR